jgi:ribonuclease HI
VPVPTKDDSTRRICKTENKANERIWLAEFRPKSSRKKRPADGAPRNPPKEPPKIKIDTDGACSDNPGRGGWAAIVLPPGQKEPMRFCGGAPDTANNRMELLAAIEGLRHVEDFHPVLLHTDSKCLRDAMTKWVNGWVGRGWRKANGDPVLNADLWCQLYELSGKHDVTWKLVKAHAGNKWNTIADRLARRSVPKVISLASDPEAIQMFVGGYQCQATAQGGWCAVLRHRGRRKCVAGADRRGSSYRMHLRAACAGLSSIRNKSLPVYVFTSLSYLYRGIRQGVPKWKSNGWKTKEASTVQNSDMWLELDRMCNELQVHWVDVASASSLDELMEAKKVAEQAAMQL